MIAWFARHPTAANLLVVVLVFMGITSLPKLQRETFPDFTPLEVEVRVPYPGASAEDVEEGICLPLEDAIDGINDVEEVRCDAREGLGAVVVKMHEGADFARFLDDVKTEAEAIDSFPEQAETPVITQLGRTDKVVAIGVTGPMAAPDLKAYAEQLKTRLQLLPEVSMVEVQGFSQHQLRVSIPAQILRQYSISMEDVANAIARQGVDLPAGTLETAAQTLLLRFTDLRRTPAELSELVVVGASGRSGELRLGDIATISDRFELDEDKFILDGQRAALLQVTKTKSQDTLTVVEAVKAFLDQERHRAPPAVRFVLTRDSSSIVKDRLQMLVRNGAQGLVLVFLVMWLFFRLRFALWVAMGLPVSFLGALFFMSVLGLSINMITMVALLIALGLLMDDAIVIAENIATHYYQKHKPPMQAAIDGIRQVSPGVLSSFITTVSVFGPLAFLAGDIGKVLKVLPVVLILVLAVSLVEAFLILPHHLGHSLAAAQRSATHGFRARFDAGLERVRHDVLGGAVDWVINQRYLFIGLVIAVFVVSIGMLASGQLKFRAFPKVEGDFVQALVLLPQGTPLARTEAVVSQLTEALERVNQELTPNQPVGPNGPRALVEHVSVQFNVNQDANETGPQVATITADLLSAEERNGHIDDFIGRWRRQAGVIPDIITVNFKEPQFGPAGRAIEIRLQGPDLDQLKAASLELQQWLSRYTGVSDLSDDLRPGKAELRLTLKDGALALDLDARTIASQLRAAFFGTTAYELQVGPENIEVDVRLAEADQASLNDLADFRIIAPGGDRVPLDTVVTITPGRGYGRINRIDRQRAVTVQGEVDGHLANTQEILKDTVERFLPELRQRYPEVHIGMEGERKESSRTAGSMAQRFLLGLMGVFLLLSFQFRSYIEPLVVMSAIPLALIGVIWGHLLMGLELSMPSMMGFASLAGIVVNDSILLVEFLKLRVREGMAIPLAAKQASRDRFRAVLLTSLTTIAGLTPLLTERSLQAQVLIPLATSIVFGLLVTTVLVLLVVPALYSILADLGWTSLQREEAEQNAETKAAVETQNPGPRPADVRPQ